MNSLGLRIGVIGRGIAVEDSTGYICSQNEIWLLDRLTSNGSKIIYGPIIVKKGDECAEHFKKIYKARLNNGPIKVHGFYGEFQKKQNIIRKIIRYFIWFLRCIRFVSKVDILLIYYPSTLGVMAIIASKIMRHRYILYKGSSWIKDRKHIELFKSDIIRKLRLNFKKYIETYVMKSSPLILVRGPVVNGNNCKYIRGNTPFLASDIYERIDTCLGKKIVIVSVCHILPNKRINDIIKAIAVVSKYNSNVIFKHIGGGYKKDIDELRALADTLGVSDKVCFLGPVKDKKKLLCEFRNSDIFILASYSEGFPRVIIEAMSQSLPVIASKTEGVEDRFNNYSDILMFEAGNHKELSDAIKRVISNQELRQRIIINGRKQAEIEFNLPMPEDTIMQAINTIISER